MGAYKRSTVRSGNGGDDGFVTYTTSYNFVAGQATDPSGDDIATTGDYLYDNTNLFDLADTEYPGVTIWGKGVISAGAATAAQLAFMDSYDGGDIFGFPGQFIALTPSGTATTTFSFSQTYFESGKRSQSISVIRDDTVLGNLSFTLDGFTLSDVPPYSGTLAIGESGPFHIATGPISFAIGDYSVTSGTALEDTLRVIGQPRTIYGLDGNDTLLGGDGADRLHGGGGADLIRAGGGADKLLGDDGDDVLEGGALPDEISGGDGADTFIYRSPYDSFISYITVDSRARPTFLTDRLIDFTSGFDRIDLTTLLVTNLTIQQLDDGTTRLLVDTVDTPHGGRAFAQVAIDSANPFTLSDVMTAPLILGSENAETLSGGEGRDRFVGGGGADMLIGGGGADGFIYITSSDSTVDAPDRIIDFERGSDTLDVSRLDASLVTVERMSTSGGAIFRIEASRSGSIQTVIESAREVGLTDIVAPQFADVALLTRGDSGANTLRPLGEKSVLRGEGGNDNLFVAPSVLLADGGGGLDTLVWNAGTAILIDGTAHVVKSEDGEVISFASLERFRGGAGDDIIAANNQFIDDTLIVDGTKYDSDFRYYLYDANDVNVLTFDDQVERSNDLPHVSIFASGSGHTQQYNFYVAGQGSLGIFDIDQAVNVDTVLYLKDEFGTVLASNDDDSDGTVDVGSTSSLDSFLTYQFDHAGGYIIEVQQYGDVPVDTDASYRLNISLSGLAGETLGGTTIDGGAGDDALTGTPYADTLIGGDGDDRLSGGGGADVMIGGAGVNIYTVDNVGDRVIGRGGIDIVELLSTDALTNLSYTLGRGLEGLSLPGLGSVNGKGNGLNNSIIGNDFVNVLNGDRGDDVLESLGGNDTLNGGRGVDAMSGGKGNDTYVVDNAGDTVVERSGNAGGVDTVGTLIDYVLGAGVENLALGGSARVGTGNAQDNRIDGSGRSDTLSGLGGNDAILGGEGRDQLIGGEGNDTLTGGADRDLLTGGAGADNFRFVAGELNATLSDLISDFSHAEGDRIYVNAIDAISGTPANDAFVFIGASTFHNVAGELRYVFVGANTLIEGDVSGDGVADLAIRLNGHVTLVATDFAL